MKPVLSPSGALQRAEQRITVRLANLVPGELALSEDFVIVRIGPDDVLRQLSEFAHRHFVAGVRQAVGIGEGRFRQTQGARTLGHPLGKGSLVA